MEKADSDFSVSRPVVIMGCVFLALCVVAVVMGIKSPAPPTVSPLVEESKDRAVQEQPQVTVAELMGQPPIPGKQVKLGDQMVAVPRGRGCLMACNKFAFADVLQRTPMDKRAIDDVTEATFQMGRMCAKGCAAATRDCGDQILRERIRCLSSEGAVPDACDVVAWASTKWCCQQGAMRYDLICSHSGTFRDYKQSVVSHM